MRFRIFLREVISEAGAVRADVAASLRAHSVRGVATFCFFPAELVNLQGAGGRNLAIELSVHFLFSRHFVCFSRTAVPWPVCRCRQYC